MSSITHFSNYDNWKLSGPENGRRKLATCPTCNTDFYGEGPEYETCFACDRPLCQNCDRHRCDGCDLWFCRECLDEINDSGGDGLTGDNPQLLCAECKATEMLEREQTALTKGPANQLVLMSYFYHLAKGGAA